MNHRILKQVRIRIAEYSEKESLFKDGEVEMDESCFRAHRIHGKRGRGSYGKTVVFGLKQGEGRVYTQVIKNCSRKAIPIPFEFSYVCHSREKGNPSIQPENFKPDQYISPLINQRISKSAIVYNRWFF